MNVEMLPRVFKVLSNPTRLKIYQLILAGACEPKIHDAKATNCAKKIARMLKLNQPTVSNHIKELVNASLVTEKKSGKNVYLFGTKKSSKALFEFANEVSKKIDIAAHTKYEDN
ncbi:MAG TPA: metalloregulator ArsR/SmtB family transcription factor [Patescibacteria group bacterium]|nr:metalloregulator ArsR/SmtB family transcription factor [Patescibacteria group bacterium]